MKRIFRFLGSFAASPASPCACSVPGAVRRAAGASGSVPGASGAGRRAARASGSVPGASGSVPGASGSVPGASGSVPGASGAVRRAAGASGSVPGASGSVPGASGSVPGAAAYGIILRVLPLSALLLLAAASPVAAHSCAASPVAAHSCAASPVAAHSCAASPSSSNIGVFIDLPSGLPTACTLPTTARITTNTTAAVASVIDGFYERYWLPGYWAAYVAATNGTGSAYGLGSPTAFANLYPTALTNAAGARTFVDTRRFTRGMAQAVANALRCWECRNDGADTMIGYDDHGYCMASSSRLWRLLGSLSVTNTTYAADWTEYAYGHASSDMHTLIRAYPTFDCFVGRDDDFFHEGYSEGYKVEFGSEITELWGVLPFPYVGFASAKSEWYNDTYSSANRFFDQTNDTTRAAIITDALGAAEGLAALEAKTNDTAKLLARRLELAATILAETDRTIDYNRNAEPAYFTNREEDVTCTMDWGLDEDNTIAQWFVDGSGALTASVDIAWSTPTATTNLWTTNNLASFPMRISLGRAYRHCEASLRLSDVPIRIPAEYIITNADNYAFTTNDAAHAGENVFVTIEPFLRLESGGLRVYPIVTRYYDSDFTEYSSDLPSVWLDFSENTTNAITVYGGRVLRRSCSGRQTLPIAVQSTSDGYQPWARSIAKNQEWAFIERTRCDWLQDLAYFDSSTNNYGSSWDDEPDIYWRRGVVGPWVSSATDFASELNAKFADLLSEMGNKLKEECGAASVTDRATITGDDTDWEGRFYSRNYGDLQALYPTLSGPVTNTYTATVAANGYMTWDIPDSGILVATISFASPEIGEGESVSNACEVVGDMNPFITSDMKYHNWR